MFNLSDQILHDLAQDGTPGALREKLTTMAASVEDDSFVKLVAREIVERTRPQQAINGLQISYIITHLRRKHHIQILLCRCRNLPIIPG